MTDLGDVISTDALRPQKPQEDTLTDRTRGQKAHLVAGNRCQDVFAHLVPSRPSTPRTSQRACPTSTGGRLTIGPCRVRDSTWRGQRSEGREQHP
ncbi:hypothetical protein M3J09_013588 [Ascochyta lentis]